jgi:alpha-1,6-mannosyltransferase
MRKWIVPICLLGALQELVWIASYKIGPFRQNTGSFLFLMLGAFIICVWGFLKLAVPSKPAASLVVAFGLLFRLTVLPALPYQSEDVYRYIWDARVAAEGISPYKYAPEASELERFRDATIYPMINSKAYITSYPPLSQALFRVSRLAFGESIIGMKAIFSLFEFCALLAAWGLLSALRQNLGSLILIAWNPLFVFEFSHSGHSDSVMMCLVLLSLYLLHRGRKASAFFGFSGAVLSKLHPALCFPVWVRRTGWKSVIPGLIAGGALLFLFFDLNGLLNYLFSLRLYYRLYEFNASIHYFLRGIGLVFFQQSWDKITGPYLVAVLLGIALLIWHIFPTRDVPDVLHAAFWIMTADLCLSTTVHPWYLSWAALALPFFPYAFMLYWTGAVFLSYVAYSYHPVYEPWWVLILEYIPMYGLMAWEIYRGGPLLRREIVSRQSKIVNTSEMMTIKYDGS